MPEVHGEESFLGYQPSKLATVFSAEMFPATCSYTAGTGNSLSYGEQVKLAETQLASYTCTLMTLFVGVAT